MKFIKRILAYLIVSPILIPIIILAAPFIIICLINGALKWALNELDQ